jgi:guanylate cyclase
MVDYPDYCPTSLARELHFRAGMNCGPVVGGVIGHTKFHYDVWGDPVNIAARMESHGEPGKIQITNDFYELIKGDFVCESRGRIVVKGKGEMETWFLVGARHAEI